MIKKIYITLFLLFTVIVITNARNINIAISDSTQISILTSYPYDAEMYTVYGHTALRVNDMKNDRDIVFNYGLFDFNAPNFAYRFAKGETDYMVGAIPFEYYLEEYEKRGKPVVEQVINLTQSEKEKIWQALVINCMPENREYRYNYLFDNCATRIRDIIEKYVEGNITYTPTGKEQLFRDLLHEHNSLLPWSAFGIDLILGSGLDRTATDREKMFLPIYLMRAYSGATIENGNETRKLVSSESIIINEHNSSSSHIIQYPLIAGCVLLLFTICVLYACIRSKLTIFYKIYTFLLFFVAGIAGCVIFFLMFFSEHPATNPNWNIIWLNPLQLIFSLFFFFKFSSKVIYYYHFINFAALSLFLLAWFLIPQQLNVAFIPYILSLLACSGANIWLYMKIAGK
ncbi:DUF4105 domain-containing protein [Dysgonomonas sp. 520]|uniref:lipoprotein N-acyltransferase Lnb domain-containing protein n=1 Tax=Dysgonomonas sp. 520 TaxID=2302931 RepID=UPI0013D316D0|nr:DUF4105 domain-containing protein [Dysgonomonas sp. 520]NDW09077.1 DUF4105 domain-containing protein [Dysgonomonas sp. 520]